MSTTVQRGLIIVVLLIAVVLVVRSFNAPLTESSPAPSPDSGVGAPPPMDGGSAALLQDLAALIPQAPDREPDPNATWVPVGEFNGSEAGQTTTFELKGSLARVRYQVESELPFLAVFFVPAAQGQASIFPDILATGETEGEVTVSKPAGSYYLTVQTISGTWSVAVEEEQVAL